MTKKLKTVIEEDDDDMRPKYDFSKMKFVGRGIYAERFRRGTKVVLLGEYDGTDEEPVEPDLGTESNVDCDPLRVARQDSFVDCFPRALPWAIVFSRRWREEPETHERTVNF